MPKADNKFLSQVVVHDLAEAKRQIRDNVRSGDDLKYRQLRQRGESVREQGQRSRPGPSTFEINIEQLVLDQLANARRPVYVRYEGA